MVSGEISASPGFIRGVGSGYVGVLFEIDSIRGSSTFSSSSSTSSNPSPNDNCSW